MPCHTCEGQRTSLWRLIPSSIFTWVPMIKLKFHPCGAIPLPAEPSYKPHLIFSQIVKYNSCGAELCFYPSVSMWNLHQKEDSKQFCHFLNSPLSVCDCVCVSGVCIEMHTPRPNVNVYCLPLWFSILLFWDRVSRWSWNFSFWLDWVDVCPTWFACFYCILPILWLQTHMAVPGLLHVFWGYELKSSCLSKCTLSTDCLPSPFFSFLSP